MSMILFLLLMAPGCDAPPPTTKQQESKKAEQVAASLKFTENAEIDNIKARLELTSQPGLIGYVVLLNEAGQPIMYTTVKGKLTSGSKRLTRTQEFTCLESQSSGGMHCDVWDSASDEGTYGSSNPYIYFWTQSGQYVQWSGTYLYSDQPIRLSVEPLVIDLSVQ